MKDEELQSNDVFNKDMMSISGDIFSNLSMPNASLLCDDMEELCTMLERQVEITNSNYKIDMTDYTVPEGVSSVLIETKVLKEILSQLEPIINLNSPRAVSRGISIKVVDNNNVDIICPNELYYFKTTLPAEVTVPQDKVIFIEYLFLTKIARFIPPKVLIYSKEETVGAQTITKYYIRLTTGDLELINTNLIDSDIKRLDLDCEIKDEVLSTLNKEETYRKLSTMIKLLPFESDTPKRKLQVFNGVATFRTSLLYAATDLNLPNIQLDIKTAKYLLRACQYCSDNEQIMILSTNSEVLPRYAISYGNTIMITHLPDSKRQSKVLDIMENVNTTVIDYSQSQYQLDYATSITYAMGTVTFENTNGTLIGKLKLQNGSNTDITIKTLDDLLIPPATKIRINAKTLLLSLNALDKSLQTCIGYQDGMLYLMNTEIKIALVSL